MKTLIILLSFSLLSFTPISKNVHATVYNAVPEQTNSDPGHTAFMFELDLNNPYKHKIIAVSRDLLKEFPKGTKVCVSLMFYLMLLDFGDQNATPLKPNAYFL